MFIVFFVVWRIVLFFFPIAATTHDYNVFSFHPDNSPCHGFEEVLSCYKKIVPHLRLSGDDPIYSHLWKTFCIVHWPAENWTVTDNSTGEIVCNLQGLPLSRRSSRRPSTLLTGVEDSIMFLSSLLMDRFSPWNEEHFCKVTLTHSLVEFTQSGNKKICGKIQVTRSVDTSDNDLSPQERRTVDSVVMARYTQTAKFQINFRLAKRHWLNLLKKKIFFFFNCWLIYSAPTLYPLFLLELEMAHGKTCRSSTTRSRLASSTTFRLTSESHHHKLNLGDELITMQCRLNMQ